MKLSGILKFLKNSFLAIIKGEFLLRLGAGRFLIHIFYTFVVMGAIIWVSLLIDTSMNKVEKNYGTIQELRTQNSILRYRMAETCGRNAVAERLKKMNSKLGEPECNAITITEK